MAGISAGLCLHLLTLLLSALASFSLADSRTGCWNMVYSILRGLRHQRECLSLTVWQNPQQDPGWPSLGLVLLVLRTITVCVHWEEGVRMEMAECRGRTGPTWILPSLLTRTTWTKNLYRRGRAGPVGERTTGR